MKVLLLNGSPRKGNTCAALDALKKGIGDGTELELKEIYADQVSVSPCIACENCGCQSHCVSDDDTNDVIGAVLEADALVFATPVYWWGMTAQMKLIIDKFYSQATNLAKRIKKVGIIVVGEAAQGDTQYDLIAKQFECICNHLGWKIAFSNSYSAGAAGDLAGNAEAMAEIEGLGKLLG